ncbi:hypothetical protein SASPL_145772 [Salvia splendens]|uniref:Uncharacterized protein n=1 Tax=Salvia splendens TaxID=180675 RepID=A0A8X8WJ09_SALSN|nr:uncharacterized protein LOC121775511 [Salvia splendens]KAG6395133.1 hypothetical protein SASPL_145772 [Salvia splendens]
MDRESLEKRPAIFVVGSPNVGKRTLFSRLLKVDFDDDSDTSLELSVNGWTINTKYYTADVAVWIANLSDELSITSFPDVNWIVALVMVFDTSDLTTLVALKEWVSRTDIQKFEILLCIGNKVDLLPGHPSHVEYKRRLMKLGDTSVNSHLEFSDYGISETEGSSLMGNEEPSLGFKISCIEWCLEHNIEYVEACASNADFDQCLSVDGDSQGVDRLYGALSAHMWPGMLLKSGDRINEPSLPEQEELSEEEESDYEPEYEVLSSASAEPWDDIGWMSADGPISTSESGMPMEKVPETSGRESEDKSIREENQRSTSASQLPKELDHEKAFEADSTSELNNDKTYEFEDLEMLMAEIGNVRNGLRLMPDFQRREMAAKLAMKMAVMFGDSSGGEEEELE